MLVESPISPVHINGGLKINMFDESKGVVSPQKTETDWNKNGTTITRIAMNHGGASIHSKDEDCQTNFEPTASGFRIDLMDMMHH